MVYIIGKSNNIRGVREESSHQCTNKDKVTKLERSPVGRVSFILYDVDMVIRSSAS